MRWRRPSDTDGNPREPSPGHSVETDRRASFTAFYADHFAAILRYCQVRIGNPSDAEDVAAQVFTQAWRAFPPDDRGSPRSWLFTIAHNSVANFYRRQGVRGPTSPLDTSQADLIPDRTDTPEDAYLRHESASMLHEALTCLPSNQREVVELRLAGLKGSEIAAVTGRSESSVKMLQFRAMGRLRQHLMSEPEPAGDRPVGRRKPADVTT